MLKLTKKADYGLIALRHVALSNRGSSSAKEIADSYGIPLPMLAKVLQTLTKAGILTSVAGTHGGYKLSRDPRAITSLEVIRAIDGPIVLTACFTEHGGCDQSDRCTVREPLRHVHEAILDLLQKMTIHGLAFGPGAHCETGREKESDISPRHPFISENAFALPVL
jgi:Rrf2 family protein